MIGSVKRPVVSCVLPEFDFTESTGLGQKSSSVKLPVNFGAFGSGGGEVKLGFLAPIKATEGSKTSSFQVNGNVDNFRHLQPSDCNSNSDSSLNNCNGFPGTFFFSFIFYFWVTISAGLNKISPFQF